MLDKGEFPDGGKLSFACEASRHVARTHRHDKSESWLNCLFCRANSLDKVAESDAHFRQGEYKGSKRRTDKGTPPAEMVI